MNTVFITPIFTTDYPPDPKTQPQTLLEDKNGWVPY
jgi:hypothetical protein